MTSAESRADRFTRELGDLKISDPAAGHPRLWQRLGAAGMVAGIVLGVVAYLVSHQRPVEDGLLAPSEPQEHGGIRLVAR